MPRSSSSAATAAEASLPKSSSGAPSGVTRRSSILRKPRSATRVAVSSASSYSGSGHDAPIGTANVSGAAFSARALAEPFGSDPYSRVLEP